MGSFMFRTSVLSHLHFSYFSQFSKISLVDLTQRFVSAVVDTFGIETVIHINITLMAYE